MLIQSQNMENRTIEILKKLISTPSFVNKTNDEREIGQWIYDFLKKNSELKVSKQFCVKDRFNIIASNSLNPEILVTGHIDTVQTNANWRKNPFSAEIEKDK